MQFKNTSSKTLYICRDKTSSIETCYVLEPDEELIIGTKYLTLKEK